MNTINFDKAKNIPILICAFNRPKYLKKLFKKLQVLKPKYLYIAIDGPRKKNKIDLIQIKKVKSIINKSINWKCSINKKYQRKNLGTKLAINYAINWFFRNVKMGIILEDDIDSDISFFRYASELLIKYRLNNRIKMISGNNYFNNKNKINESYYFSQTPGTHGWASWRRSWKEMDINMPAWGKNKNFFKILSMFKYNFTRAHFFKKRFELSYENKIDSWDYQLYYSILRNDGYIIKPKINLCKHIGWGPDATRSKGLDTFPDIFSNKIKFPLIHPKKIHINKKLDIAEDKIVRRISFLKYFFYLTKTKILNLFS
tara:strand:- start:892 stop:1836 length:945 start_codon:yes stop_codon:yes gene_type:complete